jgi:NADH dehydrogenase/NADH:ubiquinone oxidoreductase subunit G
MGALTSKPFAFTARSWELQKKETIDILDCFNLNIIVEYSGTKIFRILPNVNKSNFWINDTTRFFYDGLKRQRILTPMLHYNNTYYNISWHRLLKLLYSFNLKEYVINNVIGFNTDLESIYMLKLLSNQVKISFLFSELLYNNINIDFRNTSSKLSNIYDCILIYNCDIRREASQLIPELNKHYKNNTVIINIGYNNIFNNMKFIFVNIIDELLNGKNKLCKYLLKFKKIFMILGHSQIYNQLHNNLIFYKLSIINKVYKVNIDYMHLFPHTSIKNIHDICIYNIDNLNIYKKKILLLLNSNEVNWIDENYELSIYIGAVADNSVKKAKVIIPCTNFCESINTYIDIYGNIKNTKNIYNIITHLQNERTIINMFIMLFLNKHYNVLNFTINLSISYKQVKHYLYNYFSSFYVIMPIYNYISDNNFHVT